MPETGLTLETFLIALLWAALWGVVAMVVTHVVLLFALPNDSVSRGRYAKLIGGLVALVVLFSNIF